MSFDPRNSNLDDHDPQWDLLDEQDLPSDLADLAAQLSEDADRLATSYPATQSEIWLGSAATDSAATDSSGQKPFARWVRIAAAVAAVSLTAGAGAWMVSSRTPSASNTAQIHPPTVRQPQPLHSAQLQGAQLQGAQLQGAPLQGAPLQGAPLQGAPLQGAQLQGAPLQGAPLQGAPLQGAPLQGAPLYSAQHGAQSGPVEVTPMDSPVVPAGFFQTLSGPEQEAMLDLMEEEGLDQASLSI